MRCNVLAGSPFIVSVGGQPSGRVRETSSLQVQAPELIVPGQKAHIILKIPGILTSVQLRVFSSELARL